MLINSITTYWYNHQLLNILNDEKYKRLRTASKRPQIIIDLDHDFCEIVACICGVDSVKEYMYEIRAMVRKINDGEEIVFKGRRNSSTISLQRLIAGS